MQRLPAIQVNSVAMVSVEQVANVQEDQSSVVTMRKSGSDLSEAGSDASDKSHSHHGFGRSLRWKFSRRWVNRTILIRSRSIDPAYGSRRSGDETEKGPKARRAVSMSPFANKRIQIPPCPSPSLLAEDPPSSENVSDLEDVRSPNDPALLNGSSGNFGSAGARSAPSTPQGILGSSPGALSDSQSGISPPCSLPRSPSHNIFTKYDSKRNIKHLSCSTPVMTAQAQSPEPPSPKASSSKDGKPSAYKGRQKKFIRHFPSASEDTVLNYYSCALIGDILLQGHLYITQNYFAFYSNVFGYVTKLLIPMQSVRKISKEKTARIIPNAVGITTTEDKHVFGSLMSRDNTYKFMNEIWDTAKKLQDVALEPPEPIVDPSDESDSSETPPESGRESDIGMPKFRTCVKSPDSFSSSYTRLDGKSSDAHGGGDHSSPTKDKHFRVTTVPNLLLIVTTLVLILLFLSAALLLYRIGRVQTKYSQALQENFVISESEDVYGELLQWQTHLHSKSAGAVHSFLDTNLDQIAKVRQSLEALSTLLVPNSSGTTAQKSAAKPVDSPENS